MYKYLFFLFLFPQLIAYSQALFEPVYIDQDSSSLKTFSNKFQNIYNFSDELAYSHKGELGNLLILHNYQGQGTPLSNSRSFQEMQKLRLSYEYKIDDELFLINKENWFITSNTLNFGQNKLERLNFLFGFKYFILNNSFLELGYGKERNTTVGLETVGDYYYGNFNLTQLRIGELELDSRGYADIASLEDGRRNQDIALSLYTLKDFDQKNSIDLSLSYNNRNRDNPELNPTIDDIPIRRRKSDKLMALTNLIFSLNESTINTLSFNLNNEFISNNYLNNFEQINESNFLREVDIFRFDVINSISIITTEYKLNYLVNYSQTNEDYSAQNILDLTSNQFDIYKSDQNRQDRIVTFFNINLDNAINLSSVDSINIGIDYRLLRFDTPSNKNNDDRDELSIAGDIEYIRKISNILSIGIRNEFRFFHYVYLKSQRSSSNNWNRIIRLSPTILLQSNYLYYKPEFGINANYTTYDFENIVTGINSFSFREFSYLDTIQIKLTNKYYVESKNEIRYSERGILYWDEFSEQPQRSNFESFFRTLFIFRNETIKLGSGFRYFKRKDIRISELITQNSVILNDFESVSPEIILEYQFDSKNKIKFDLWYEFQSINLIRKNELINFYLSTQIRL